MSRMELAQLNIARLKNSLESPELADFVSELDRVNSAADNAAGFRWRFIASEMPDAVDPFGSEYISTLSVWDTVESLHQFVYKDAHAQIMSQRKKWFNKIETDYQVLWWVHEGHQPTLVEAHQKLQLLITNGPGPRAFTFKSAFDQNAIE